jgi:hypothetical protein
MKTQIVVVFLVLLEHSDSYLAEAQPLTELIYSIISSENGAKTVSDRLVDLAEIKAGHHSSGRKDESQGGHS